MHRHEPPVLNLPVKILHSRLPGVVAVNKPATIPVHPSGRYRRNSLMGILAKEAGLLDLHVIHRLDRLTSGIVLFATDNGTAARLGSLFASREVEKVYLAKVMGAGPEEPEVRVCGWHC